MSYARDVLSTHHLLAAAAFALVGMLAQPVAQGADVNGSFGSGGSSGSASASLGGGGGSATASANGPGGASGRGSLSFGRGSGIAAQSSSGTIGNTHSNFTASIGGGNGANGSTTAGSGNSSFGLGFGQPSSFSQDPGAVLGTSAASINGIAAAINDLSLNDRQKLARACATVLAAPQRYDVENVAVCRVLASL
jgi:hypothetical protein